MVAQRRPILGLALGSGGARGWCHIGVLRELEAMGIRPDVISGASMGAFVGAIYAGGSLDALEDWACNLTGRQFFGMLDVRPGSGGLIQGGEIPSTIRRLVKQQQIEDLPIPLALVATDMATGREVWMTKGDLADAVRASVALPGVISPIRIDDRWFLDGGLTNPVPVSVCRVLGAEVVIAVNPNGRLDGTFWAEREQQGVTLWKSWGDRLRMLPAPVAEMLLNNNGKEAAPHYLDVLSASIDIMTDGIRRTKLAGDPPHVLLDAHLSDLSVLDFHRAREAIEEGHRLVRENADAIAQVMRL
ncbi:patatin-like phospholipase family protein [Lutimaribacter pacificus]|nr:patatin-like phospholipase family protein [Lutimaribacter pacificus]